MDMLVNILLGLGGIAVVVFGSFIAGSRRQKKKQQARAERAQTTRKRHEDEINEADPDDVQRRLDGWMRD